MDVVVPDSNMVGINVYLLRYHLNSADMVIQIFLSLIQVEETDYDRMVDVQGSN